MDQSPPGSPNPPPGYYCGSTTSRIKSPKLTSHTRPRRPPPPPPPPSPRVVGGGPITLAPAREARRRERSELGRKPRGARPAFFPPLLTPPTSYHFSPHHIPTIAHARPHLIPSTPNDVDTRGARSSTFSTTTPVIQSSPAILNQKQCTIRRGAKFEMASNTQELNNAVASIMPMTEQEKASTSRVRCRSTSPDLFEEEEEVRPVKKVCQRPAAKVGPISKYRATCNRTNPYAGSWSTAPNSLRPSTPPAAVVNNLGLFILRRLDEGNVTCSKCVIHSSDKNT
ncbi:uncharacterized protein [Leptinotarsa decemlineata]|uniref:uncharacterized protein n=1 Tax=Leptinotarsa decemlineata TaxID=7539 RepID=UPI003D30BAEE